MEGDILMKIQESAENYLETILMLGKAKGNVRSIDIATALSFSKPSVSVAMKNLRENGYILMDKDGFIALTEKGHEIAETIYERHTLLSSFLTASIALSRAFPNNVYKSTGFIKASRDPSATQLI